MGTYPVKGVRGKDGESRPRNATGAGWFCQNKKYTSGWGDVVWGKTEGRKRKGGKRISQGSRLAIHGSQEGANSQTLKGVGGRRRTCRKSTERVL